MPHAKLILGLIVLVAVVALGVRMLPSKPPAENTVPSADFVKADEFNVADVSGFLRHDLPKVLTFRSPTTFVEHMDMSRPYLTEDGYAQVGMLFKQMRLFEENEATEMRFTSEPAVKLEKDAAGNAYWLAEFNVEIDFIGGGSTRTDPFSASLIITGKNLNGEQALGIKRLALTALAKPQ